MTQQFAVGDRVVIQGFHPDLDGREGTVTQAEPGPYRAYPYRVRVDNDSDWNIADGRLFTPAELVAVSKPVPEPGPPPRFAPGDRVVYTIPETFGGEPGVASASRADGEVGTVIGGYGSAAAFVEWDNEAPQSNTSVEFLAHAPKPTHKYPEGLYRVGQRGARVFIAHADGGTYSIAYLDNRTARGEVPVNNDMTERIVGSYTLIAAA